MGTTIATIATVAAAVLLLATAYLAWTRRQERVRNAELQVKLIMREAELVARRVQIEHLMGHKEVIPQPRPSPKPKRERPHYLKPLAVVGAGAVTFAAWLKEHAAVTASLAAAGAVLMWTPAVAPPPQTRPPVAGPNQGAPPTRQEFPGPTPSSPELPYSELPPSSAPPPVEVPPTTSAPASEAPAPPEPTTGQSEPTEQPTQGGDTPEQPPPEEPSEPPDEEPPEEPSEPPPCIEVTVPPEVNLESCLDIL